MEWWPSSAEALERLQRRLAELADRATLWRPSGTPQVGAVFVTFSTAREGRPAEWERAWAAAVVPARGALRSAVVSGAVHSGYEPGLLALRAGELLERAARSLPALPEALLVNASGRDHPRRAGLALHLGAALDVPTVGVTDRPLVARGEQPGADRGERSPLVLAGEVVGYRVRTRRNARPVCVHAAWRTDAEVACEVVTLVTARARTPEPLREARTLARSTRARDEGRAPSLGARGPSPTVPLDPGRRALIDPGSGREDPRAT